MTYTRGFTSGTSPIVVKPVTTKRSNVFKVGDPVVVRLKGTGATSYRVLDYTGNVVESGTLNNTVSGTTLPLGTTAPGCYRLLLDGASDQGGQWGTSVGDTNITITRATSPLPTFPDPHFQRLVLTRIDPRFVFYWQDNGPDPSTGKNNFSARWDGFIQCPVGETVSLSLGGGEGVRVWVGAVGDNDVPLIDSWDGFSSRSGIYTFTANQRLALRVEYWNGDGNSGLELTWSSPSLGTQQVSAGAFFQAASGSAAGLVGKYYNDTDFNTSGAASDGALTAVFGLGVERWKVSTRDNNGNPLTSAQIDTQIADLKHNIAAERALRVGHLDPARPQNYLAAFENGTDLTEYVTRVVTQCKDIVTHWETQNEPQDAYTDAAAFYLNQFKPFRDLVKSIKPTAKVIGPASVSIGPKILLWVDAFLQACPPGGMDGFSFHVYNDILGDANHARHCLNALLDSLKRHGHEGIELWQTEQGADVSWAGVYHPRHQCEWIMREQMLFEQIGLPKERNHIWYVLYHGFLDYCQWLENEDKSLNPLALAQRTYAEEVWGTQFKRALDFGTPGNDLMMGNLFENPVGSPFKRVVQLMSNGAVQSSTQTSFLNVDLVFSTNQAVKIVNAWGAESSATPVNGHLILPVGEVPTYIEVNSGQNVDVVPYNWGVNCAALQDVVASSNHEGSYLADDGSGNLVTVPNPISKITDGELDGWYYFRTLFNEPWIAASPGNVSRDTNTVDSNGNLLTPTVVELDLARQVTAKHVVIYSCQPWQLQGTIRRGTVEGLVNNQWQLLGTISQADKTVYASSPQQRSKLETYFDNAAIFVVPVNDLVLNKVRLTVTAVTKGGAATPEVASAGTYDGYNRLTLREFAVHGEPVIPLPPSNLKARFWPPTEDANALVGGKFQGSNDGTNYTDLATIATQPAQNQYNSLDLGATPYRFMRYLSPRTTGGRGPAELQFWRNGQRVKGGFFGSAGAYAGIHSRMAEAAMDGAVETFYDALTGVAFLGIDTQSPPLTQPRIASAVPVVPASGTSGSGSSGAGSGITNGGMTNSTSGSTSGQSSGSGSGSGGGTVSGAGSGSGSGSVSGIGATSGSGSGVVVTPDVTKPGIPQNLQATPISATTINLTWSAANDH